MAVGQTLPIFKASSLLPPVLLLMATPNLALRRLVLLQAINLTTAFWEMGKSITANTCSHVGMGFGQENWLIEDWENHVPQVTSNDLL